MAMTTTVNIQDVTKIIVFDHAERTGRMTGNEFVTRRIKFEDADGNVVQVVAFSDDVVDLEFAGW